MEWFPAVMTLVGVLVGVGIQEVRIQRERRDKYKDMVFERRLDAHQGAFYECMRLINFVRPDSLVIDGGVAKAVKETFEAHEWLNKNALYLDVDSRTKISELFNSIYEMAFKYYKDDKWRESINIGEETRKLVDKMAEVIGCIQRGIGAEYLPERKGLTESIDTEQRLAELIEAEERLIEEKMKSR
jgi:hypothetical protein